MQDEHVDAISAAWQERTGTDPDALRAFLTRSVPDVEVWALRRGGVQPELLAVDARHLYRVMASEVDGRPAFGFDRWPFDEIALSLVEWADGDGYRRRWTLRMHEAAFTVDSAGEESLEAVMGVLASRAR